MNITVVHQPDPKLRRGYREVTVIGLPNRETVKVVNPEPAPTRYSTTSTPELLPGRHGAGCSPFFDWIESRQPVEQG